MTQDFTEFARLCRLRVDTALRVRLPEADSQQPSLASAMGYSLFNGGKRVRPTLVYATGAALDRPADEVLDGIACALECIHAYSLVHDDLPAMDDDDLRRGQPSCHIAYDEATAILAGDALQALAFEWLTELPLAAETRLSLIAQLSRAAGMQGMVLGQAIDLGAVNQHPSIEQLERMHRFKTGALIDASVLMAARVCAAGDAQLKALGIYSRAIGLAFQVQDDILDVTAETQTLGKQQGADLSRNKPTYVSLLGLTQARAKAQHLCEQALDALSEFDSGADQLRALAHYIVQRGN